MPRVLHRAVILALCVYLLCLVHMNKQIYPLYKPPPSCGQTTIATWMQGTHSIGTVSAQYWPIIEYWAYGEQAAAYVNIRSWWFAIIL